MHPEADRVLATLNAWINTNEVLTLLAVAAVSGFVGWLFRVTRRGRRFGWSVLYDEPINQGDPSARPRRTPDKARRRQRSGPGRPGAQHQPDVNQTPSAIGYAEADALPFFPDVGAIPVNGYEPTRANALKRMRPVPACGIRSADPTSVTFPASTAQPRCQRAPRAHASSSPP